MIRQSETTASLAAALSLAQGEIENADKDSTNPHFKSGYASLAETLNVIRPVFTKHGLSVAQVPTIREGGSIQLTTRLMHKSGEFIEGDYPIEPVKKDPQGYGSAVTYARRYSLMAVTGIAAEDDDGNEASSQPAKPVQVQQKPYDKEASAKAEKVLDKIVPIDKPRFTAPTGKDQSPTTETTSKAAANFVPTAKLHELLKLVQKIKPELSVEEAKAEIVAAAKKAGASNIKSVTEAQYARMEDELRQEKIS